MPADVCLLAPLPDTTEVVNLDQRVSPYWRVWLHALMTAVNELHCGVQSGLGSPEGVVLGSVGTLYRRTDGGAGSTFYVKESGSGSTGWVAFGTPVVTGTGTIGQLPMFTAAGVLGNSGLVAAQIGVWTAVPFTAAHFTATGGMTWTVDAGDVIDFRWAEVRNVLIVKFAIATASVAAPLSNVLQILIPNGRTAANFTAARLATLLDSGVEVGGQVSVAAGGTVLQLTRADTANFAASLNNTFTYGEIVLAIAP